MNIIKNILLIFIFILFLIFVGIPLIAIIIQVIFGSTMSFLPGDTVARYTDMIGALGGSFIVLLIVLLIVFTLWFLFRKSKKHNKVNEKICPFCAEEIKLSAIVCKHCGRDIE
tara:strand:+ start:91 stop:429 length:339 start_codon:yes stop_codon:yes gene_type:complete